MKLSNLCEIKTNFADADFWIVRKGSEMTVGTPTREFAPQHIGVKVVRTDVLVPGYLFYVVMYLHSQGYFQVRCNGTLRLKHILVSDIKGLQVGLTP
jgi:hypothetical protein